MTDYWLRGLKEIYEDVFQGKDGVPIISFDSFRKKYVEDMKRLGVLKPTVIGRGKQRTTYLCGFKSEIQRYLMLRAQKEYEKNHEIAAF